jgi:peptidylprolyl isomerase
LRPDARAPNVGGDRGSSASGLDVIEQRLSNTARPDAVWSARQKGANVLGAGQPRSSPMRGGGERDARAVKRPLIAASACDGEVRRRRARLVAMPLQPAIKPPPAKLGAAYRGHFMLVFSRRAALALPLIAASAAFAAEDADNTIVLTTKQGKIVIRLRPDWAPKHVEQIKTLVKRKFYDGIVFHRVIPGFMAQTGDPTGTGTGGSDLPNLPAEFNKTHFTRGILGMARSNEPDSANSQFFITTADASFLDGKYTAFGEVTSGMDVVDKIKAGTEANNGAVTDPDKIVTMRMASGSK